MPSLPTLPTELIVQIGELLPPADIKNFSSTSRRLRHAVTHILFRTLNIACPLVSHQLLDHMLKKYERVISRIHLHIYLRPNLRADFVERGFRIIPVSLDSDGNVMPAVPPPNLEETHEELEVPFRSIWGTPQSDTLEKLVHGQTFSHINSFSVHFDPCQFEVAGRWYGDNGAWGDEDGTGGINLFEDGETEEDVYESEMDYIWREQYNQVFEDLTKNPNITKLRFVNLPPKRATVWYSEEWATMLQRLTHFDVGIFGADNGRWSGDRTAGFTEFIGDFPEYIARHLKNAKHLRLEASLLSPFGTDIDRVGIIMFPLHPSTSALHSLELKNIVLGPEFLEYLRDEPKTLCELTFHNCHTNAAETHWSEIWETIMTYNKAMKRVNFLQDKQAPLPHHAAVPSRRSYETVLNMLEENKDLIVWPHIRLYGYSGPRGKLSADKLLNLREVRSGVTYNLYRELMDMLSDRRENSADEREKDESSSETQVTETE